MSTLALSSSSSNAISSSMSSFSAWAGSDLDGIDDDTDLEVILTLSVLAKSNSCGVGDVPVVLSTGLRLGIGEVAEYEVALEIKVGRTSLVTPPRPRLSPVAANLPLPSTPVVELLILLTFGAEPDAEAAAGGLVAESTDCTGTEDGTTVGNGDGFGAGECCESDNRSNA